MLRFNGAATFRLRKDYSKALDPYLRDTLQWGRNLSVAEGACIRQDTPYNA